MSYSGWLTSANTILRCYVEYNKPSAVLKDLVDCVINFINGPKHFISILSCAQKFSL